jgi:hypothetical protein
MASPSIGARVMNGRGAYGRWTRGAISRPLALSARVPDSQDGRRRACGGTRPGDVLPCNACISRLARRVTRGLAPLDRSERADRRGSARSPACPLPESIVDQSQPLSESEVRDVLARLPDSHRRVLELVYVHGYSHAEVAAMTGTSEGAVKTAAWRAREAFRGQFLSGTESGSDSGPGATS